MPFTFAHLVVAIPLRRRLGRFASLPALAVGAMVPDLAYFVPLGVSGAQSHSVAGLFWFCLPAGLAAWVAYLALVRPFVLALSPAAIAARVGAGGPVGWSWRRIMRATVSIVVASATHVLWDSFTHSTGAGVEALAVLRRPVPLFPGYTPFVFTILQHGSTLLGLSVLAYWGLRWFFRTSPTQPVRTDRPGSRVRYSVVLACLVPSAVAGVYVLWARAGSGEGLFPVLQNNLGRAIFSAGSVFIVTFLASALAWRLVWARLGVRGCPTSGSS